jgi:hypothetical protein
MLGKLAPGDVVTVTRIDRLASLASVCCPVAARLGRCPTTCVRSSTGF